jgi:hypothetical protein
MKQTLMVPEVVEKKILLIRGQKVLLSIDIAALYDVEHRALMQAVNRNLERFPEDFMFQLTHEEFRILKSQYVTSSWGGIRKLPFAFTEKGIAMLSSVLHSKRAIQVNIDIMRVPPLAGCDCGKFLRRIKTLLARSLESREY